jgi:hypothetical protein
MRYALLALAALAMTVPAEARTWKQVHPLPAQKTLTVASEGVAVMLTPVPYPDEAEDAEDGLPDGYEDVTIEVRFPGLPPYKVPWDAYRSSIYGISVGIGRMARGDAAPTVLLGGYTGGAHCCATLQVVSLVEGRPVTATLPKTDGVAMHRFPGDLDGDGTADIRWDDDGLQYQFASHAGSRSVPRVYNMAGGEAVNVSREPGFAPIFRDFARKTLKSCRKNTTPENGDCAAYAYAMANLGQAEEGIRTAATLARTPDPLWLPQDCSVEYDEDFNCPEGKAITFESFEPALRYLMRKHGYLP